MRGPIQDPIARRFDRAALTYGASTPVQRQVAAVLADRIRQSGIERGTRAAELGCGTGYLPGLLWSALKPSLWVATDLAPAMVTAAAQGLPEGGAVVVMDAARPALRPGFDLVCSSLVLQWLANPAEAVRRWRALAHPAGILAVSTLIEGSFGEWRAALAEAGLKTPGPVFPPLDEARGWFGPQARVETLTLVDRHPDGLSFARAAKAAGIDAGGGRALDAGAMRRALKAFEARGAAVTYVVLIVVERIASAARLSAAGRPAG